MERERERYYDLSNDNQFTSSLRSEAGHCFHVHPISTWVLGNLPTASGDEARRGGEDLNRTVKLTVGTRNVEGTLQ